MVYSTVRQIVCRISRMSMFRASFLRITQSLERLKLHRVGLEMIFVFLFPEMVLAFLTYIATHTTPIRTIKCTIFKLGSQKFTMTSFMAAQFECAISFSMLLHLSFSSWQSFF